MSDTRLIELAEQCERAAEGSRLLDALIEVEVRRWQAYACGLNDRQRGQWEPIGGKGEVQSQGVRYHAPLYTMSFDAAFELTKALPFPTNVTMATFYQSASVMPCDPDSTGIHDPRGGHSAGAARNPILALCAAALRARAEVKYRGRR